MDRRSGARNCWRPASVMTQPHKSSKGWPSQRQISTWSRRERRLRPRSAARESVDRILHWEFDRIIVSHGEVLETGGRERFAAAFAFL